MTEDNVLQTVAPSSIDMQQLMLGHPQQPLPQTNHQNPVDAVAELTDPLEEITKHEDSSVHVSKGKKKSKEQKVEPMIKHWLYSKVYHEEFRFQDFLTLKKKIFDMRDNGVQNQTAPVSTVSAVNAASAIKTERKQKAPKKLTRDKIPAIPNGNRTYTVLPSNVIAAAASAAGVPSAPSNEMLASNGQQQAVAAVAAALNQQVSIDHQEQFIIPHLLNLNQMIPQQPNPQAMPSASIGQGHQLVSIPHTIDSTGQPSVMNLSMSSLASVNLVPQTTCNYIPPATSFYQ